MALHVYCDFIVIASFFHLYHRIQWRHRSNIQRVSLSSSFAHFNWGSKFDFSKTITSIAVTFRETRLTNHQNHLVSTKPLISLICKSNESLCLMTYLISFNLIWRLKVFTVFGREDNWNCDTTDYPMIMVVAQLKVQI